MSHDRTLRTAAPVIGVSLSQAVERLDKALLALEERLRNLDERTQPAANPISTDSAADPDLLGEIEALRERERVLEEAANGAYAALGEAAANIRQLMDEEAA
ncbi:hypothetical protein [Asticcacaulis tiandongensis]|uniref:hypothetical protein n=1 Tax=Asticcacaulis tiandongensis TaxID=2565365 RepID=UPI0011270A0C|nr:hypothetical protein [Asticcacaulis tiandongensis]